MKNTLLVLAALLVALPVWGQQPNRQTLEAPITAQEEVQQRWDRRFDWHSQIWYAQGFVVWRRGHWYVALRGQNQKRPPESEPLWWKKMTWPQRAQGGTGTVHGSTDNLVWPPFNSQITAQSTIAILPPCAFGLSRVEVYWPSMAVWKGSRTDLLDPKPRKRLSCPYERAIALYSDERVKYVAGEPTIVGCTPGQFCIQSYSPARVEVCDDDGKTNCVVVYTEPLK